MFTIIHSHFQEASDLYDSQTGESMGGVIRIASVFKSLMAALAIAIL